MAALALALFLLSSLILALAAGAAGPSLIVGPNVNLSQTADNQMEVAIAIDPNDRDNLFAFSNHQGGGNLLRTYRHRDEQGNLVWAPAEFLEATLSPHADPTAAWDRFGNLFIAYLTRDDPRRVNLAVSTDGGESFAVKATFTIPNPAGGDHCPPGTLSCADLPTVTTGPSQTAGSSVVWVTYRGADRILVRGAEISGSLANSGPMDNLFSRHEIPSSDNCYYNDIAIDSLSRVVIACQSLGYADNVTRISVSWYPYNGTDAFSPLVEVAQTYITDAWGGDREFIPAQPDRLIGAEVGVAFDRAPTSPHQGRLYLIYTGKYSWEGDDTRTFYTYANNFFADPSWSEPAEVDYHRGSQFLPRIAVDQTTGNVAVSWHDTRNDAAAGGEPGCDAVDDESQLFAAVGTNLGNSDFFFHPSVQVSAGISCQARANPSDPESDLDYGDYSGLAFDDGVFYPAWADNSSGAKMEIYTAPVSLADTDGDGVADVADNCLLAANASQDDTDADGCGNLCDADYDQDRIVGFVDFGEFAQNFGTTHEEFCHADPALGCTVGFDDFGFFGSHFGAPPGPSGIAPSSSILFCPPVQ